MEAVYCTFCKSDKVRKCYPTTDIFEENYYIYFCETCDAYFLSPFPTESQIERAYNSTYYGEHEEKFNGIIEKIIDFFRRKRAKRLAKQLESNASILDIGCGNGKFLQHTLKYGKFKIFGLEMEGNSAKRAERIPELSLKIGTLKQNMFENNQFDAITLYHVFEHIANAKEYLNIISAIIKPNGVLVISIPNINSFQSKIFRGNWLHLDPPRHLIFFNDKALINTMRTYGFELKKSYYFSMEQNPFGMIQSILNIFCNKRDVLFERLKGNNAYAPQYGKLNMFLQKTFFMLSFPIFVFTDFILSLFKYSATFELHFIKKY